MTAPGSFGSETLVGLVAERILYFVFVLSRHGAAGSLALPVPADGGCRRRRFVALLTHHSHGTLLARRWPAPPPPPRYRTAHALKDDFLVELWIRCLKNFVKKLPVPVPNEKFSVVK